MKLGTFQLCPRSAVIVRDCVDPFDLIKFEPNLRTRLLTYFMARGSFSFGQPS
jgi:hypothetical protein